MNKTYAGNQLARLAGVSVRADFRARYEAIETGFADYLVAAMRSWSRRQS